MFGKQGVFLFFFPSLCFSVQSASCVLEVRALVSSLEDQEFGGDGFTVIRLHPTLGRSTMFSEL